ncbi:MAG: nucleotidyltransferase domain-containing protein [Opitutales bacterium]|nr:nucleotidyltransferase domain-containing protein [Opitutales bacterium]
MNALETLFPKVRAELLRLLFADPERTLHLREIARLSGLAIGTVQGEVGRLCAAELLLQRRDGNRLYFRANREHPLFPELRGIALKTSGLRAQLTAALDGLAGVELAFVYGSFAAGTAETGSDIDLMVIGKVGLRKLAPRLREAAETLGREVNPHVIAPASWVAKRDAGDAYVRRVIEEPKIWIKGSDDELARLA